MCKLSQERVASKKRKMRQRRLSASRRLHGVLLDLSNAGGRRLVQLADLDQRPTPLDHLRVLPPNIPDPFQRIVITQPPPGRQNTQVDTLRRSANHQQEGHMATARDIMTGNAECVSVNDTLTDAARKLRDLDVGAMPICGDDNRLKGMLTDRDIVVKCIADGGDPSSTKVSELAEGKPVTIGADDSVEETLRTMKEYGVRRLPVIDGHKLVGIVSQADVARNLPDDKIGDLVEAISSAPSNSD